MGSAQGDRQQTVRNATGTALNYNGDWSALFDQDGIPQGDWNGRLLNWINDQLGTSYTEINGAMYAFAVANGALNWSGMGTFILGPGGSASALLLEGDMADDAADGLLLEGDMATGVLLLEGDMA